MRPTRTVAALALLVLTFAVFSVNPAAQNAALFLAAERGDVEGIERLVKENGNVNVAGDLRYGDRSYRVSAVGAAALGWHADAARTLLKHGAMPPQYVVRNHNLLPYSDRELDALRDWEVVNSVLRMPELAAINLPAGTYELELAEDDLTTGPLRPGVRLTFAPEDEVPNVPDMMPRIPPGE